ncbi:MAG: hypothetical protein ACE3JK_10765 [Sporolactobacillus sp.]
MEKIIEDVLLDLLQVAGLGIVSLIGYYIYHSAALKRLEKYVVAIEKKSPVLETVIEKIKTDAEKLLDSQEAKDATASAIATLLQKKGLKNVTEAEVTKAINALESGGEAATAAQSATTVTAQPTATTSSNNAAQKQDFVPAK